MFNLIIYSVIFLSLVGLVIVVYRKIPQLAQLSNEEISILQKKRSFKDKLREINYKQHWLNFIIRLEKILRRIRIFFLKIENILGGSIDYLRRMSQILSQKSKEWIQQKELKRKKLTEKKETKEEISVKIADESAPAAPVEEVDDDISIDDLGKPIKEEQQWIDLIVENPKNITAYKFLGLFYWKQHNYTDAKSSLEMAVKLGSKDKRVKEALQEMKKMNIK